jgi:hypothetical protein
MLVRKAVESDYNRIMEIYENARVFMAKTGNPHQWGDLGYPYPDLIKEDIEEQRLLVITVNEIDEGVFFWSLGVDPTYVEIDGQWLNDKPYGVIHRIAGSGKVKGILKTAVEYGLQFSDNIKIDTHVDNTVMQSALEKLGFKYCGMVYLPHGVWMKAYQFSK